MGQEEFPLVFQASSQAFYLTKKNKTPTPPCSQRNWGAYIKFVDLVEVAFVIVKPRHPPPNFR
jgi:hypothetical protein